MIRKFQETDLSTIMQIWIDTNIQTHHFIPKDYWISNYAVVKVMLPQAELYIYEDDNINQIDGFIGLTDNYIAGIFVRDAVQSKGIGKQLLDYVKAIKPSLTLCVYQQNIHAIRFYQRENFVIQSENIDTNTNEKEYLMVWRG